MQTTLTATLIENQDNIENIKSQLDNVVISHSYKNYLNVFNGQNNFEAQLNNKKTTKNIVKLFKF